MLRDKMMALLKKKKQEGGELGDMEKQAKQSVLSDLRDTMASEMSDRLKGLKKVTVASDSEEGLKSGLDKAKDLVEKKHGMMDHGDMEEGSQEEEDMESPEEESSEDESTEEPMSNEKIDEMIAKLQAMKKK